MSECLSPLFRKVAFPLVALVFSLANFSFAATTPSITVLTPPVTKHLGAPLRMAFDPMGNFFVTDPRKGGVSKFDSRGQFLESVKTPVAPQGIAMNDRGNLLVSQGNSVLVMDQNGTERGHLGSETGQFRKANGIAIDAAGYAYVADTMDNTVKVFTANGRFVKAIGSKGNGPGQFSMPTGIAYEKTTNQIAVTDTQNGRVQFFNASGNYDFVKSIGSFGFGPLQFRSPGGIAFDYDLAGNLNRMYVVDTYLNLIQVIDPAGTGTYLTTIGNNGLASGQLTVPVDVAFDPTSKRLAVVNASGKISMFGVDGGSTPTGAAQTLNVSPIPNTINVPSITIEGTVKSTAVITVKTNNSAAASAVTYSSSGDWSCVINGLVPGANQITILATDSTGLVSRDSVSITYTPLFGGRSLR